jgi:hypothetical protein
VVNATTGSAIRANFIHTSFGLNQCFFEISQDLNDYNLALKSPTLKPNKKPIRHSHILLMGCFDL